MIVCTLNFHRAHNFGAVLVAHSLIEKLRQFGCDAYCADYWPSYHAVRYIKSHPKLQSFIDGLPMVSVENLNCDLLIYGSDCVWNIYDFSGMGTPDPYYLGDNPIKHTRSVAYSVSTAVKDYFNTSRSLFAEHLPKHDAISARERGFSKYLQQFTDKPVLHTCDPLLLLGKDYWGKFASQKLVAAPYALFYNQQFNAGTVSRIAGTIHETTGLPVLIIGTDFTLKDEDYKIVLEDIGPNEFVSAFRYADFVLSSSFHGVVFSVLFKKQFYSISYRVGKSRTADFLDTIGIKEREIDHSKHIDIQNVIDYSVVNDRLQAFVKQSDEYLKQQIVACNGDSL
jgi:hypothetical protein